MDGVLRCSRYAFGPNRLHYCGPDANKEILSYIREGMNDLGLESLLQGFRTMYPYLNYISRVNHIPDPFDEKVVEAYWIGNQYLEHVDKQSFYRHLLEDHHLKKRFGQKTFDHIAEKIGKGALPHHSFHVFNIWKRTGHDERIHTLESMDACRISWGIVQEISGPFITIKTQPIALKNNRLVLGDVTTKKITHQLDADFDVDDLKVGGIVSMHWGVICEILSPSQLAMLKKYTQKSIDLANADI